MPAVEELGTIEAIYRRRAIRDYTPARPSHDVIRGLAAAGVHAPTAMHEEPCLFTVIQDETVLKQLSDDAKDILRRELKPFSAADRNALAMVNDPAFNIFYNATTLVVIWAKPASRFAVADCWLAAENFMLAACAQGLGTCVIGFAVDALNTPKWRDNFNLHEKMVAVAPLILGVPASEPKPVPRKAPEIIFCE